MTLPHEQDADAVEIAKLRAEIEKLKSERSKDAIEALSIQGELDAAILKAEEAIREHKAAAELWLKEERAHEGTLLELENLKSKIVVGGMPAPGLLCIPERDWNRSEGAIVEMTKRLIEADAREKEMRLDFESIVVRCTEGDKRVDWLPTIRSIAEKWTEKRPCSGGECKLEDGHDGDHVVNLKRRCPHLYTKHDFGALLCADCGQPLMR